MRKSERTYPIQQHFIGTRYSSIGSIDGKMEMISLHKKPKFVVYHSRTQRAVSCIFSPDMFDQVKGWLGKRVNVSGTVFYNKKSEPLRVVATDIRLLREESELPTIDALLGIAPDLTGKLYKALDKLNANH